MTGDPSWGVAGEGQAPGMGRTEVNFDSEERRIESYRVQARRRALELRRYMIEVEGELPGPKPPTPPAERKRAFELAMERAAQISAEAAGSRG